MNRPLRFDPIAAASEQWRHREAAGAMAAATSIMRAQQIVLSATDGVLRPLRLTFARYEVLKLLAFTRRGELPLGKIGERLMVHPTSVTNSIDRLELDGLVDRHPHPSDRRTTLAAITRTGRIAVDQATDLLDASLFGLGALSPHELRVLTETITVLRRAAGDFRAEE